MEHLQDISDLYTVSIVHTSVEHTRFVPRRKKCFQILGACAWNTCDNRKIEISSSEGNDSSLGAEAVNMLP